jgi:hypothetical protein
VAEAQVVVTAQEQGLGQAQGPEPELVAVAKSHRARHSRDNRYHHNPRE